MCYVGTRILRAAMPAAPSVMSVRSGSVQQSPHISRHLQLGNFRTIRLRDASCGLTVSMQHLSRHPVCR